MSSSDFGITYQQDTLSGEVTYYLEVATLYAAEHLDSTLAVAFVTSTGVTLCSDTSTIGLPSASSECTSLGFLLCAEFSCSAAGPTFAGTQDVVATVNTGSITTQVTGNFSLAGISASVSSSTSSSASVSSTATSSSTTTTASSSSTTAASTTTSHATSTSSTTATGTSTTATSTNNNSSSGPSSAVLIGSIVGGVAVVLIALGIFCFFRRSNRHKRRQETELFQVPLPAPSEFHPTDKPADFVAKHKQQQPTGAPVEQQLYYPPNQQQPQSQSQYEAAAAYYAQQQQQYQPQYVAQPSVASVPVVPQPIFYPGYYDEQGQYHYYTPEELAQQQQQQQQQQG
ncbi:hypothetical protein HK100_007027 [Physocladia obscura]|uniref:Mid2 domain-containing protein n=1 Tax=Physocladia obscura TaxID=109957 RepID=A0AAD5XF09_9FUNG|nr:hypothetical protein HK100_007027 [Physocladia obscura]